MMGFPSTETNTEVFEETSQNIIQKKTNMEVDDPLAIFNQLESNVRSYCRSYPVQFERAQGPWLFDNRGKSYIDFFCGAGALNYGHNPQEIKTALIRYLEADGIAHGLDMATEAKANFLQTFHSTILKPRNLNYLLQFVGPTGANGVEAGLKLARKIKKRSSVVAFTNGYHGLSSGALSVTANTFYRNEFYTQRSNVVFMPYDGYMGPNLDSLEYFERCLIDRGSGLDLPAAVILETVQAEGGINVAAVPWLQRLSELCKRFDILLIVDDIQVGCGRTGKFFSFERAEIEPDIVILSKSISAFGLPMSLVLLKPELDIWQAGEHTGTFRGNNLAFVTATKALERWQDIHFEEAIQVRSDLLLNRLQMIAVDLPELEAKIRGLGLIFGLEIKNPNLAKKIRQNCFENGLIVELCGTKGNVLKFLPPLSIDTHVLQEGLDRLHLAIKNSL